jgi:hypothetical protein
MHMVGCKWYASVGERSQLLESDNCLSWLREYIQWQIVFVTTEGKHSGI